MHKNEKGFGYIPKGSVVNLSYNKEMFKIGSINQGSGKRYFLIKKDVEKFNWEAGGKQILKKIIKMNLKLQVGI